MHDCFIKTPEDITMMGLGEEVRTLLSRGHVNELDCLDATESRIQRYFMSTCFDRDDTLGSWQADELTDCR